MKKIIALTGIRSEYDILYPLLQKLKKNFKHILLIKSPSLPLSKVSSNMPQSLITDLLINNVGHPPIRCLSRT